MKIEILYTQYEKYFAENLAAIIINNGGSANLVEVITNENYLINHSNGYQKVLIFPSIFLVYHTQGLISFLEHIIRLGCLEKTICFDYSDVNDVVDKSLCKEALSFLATKFKKIEAMKKNICLDQYFHKKIGVLNTSEFKYIVINSRNSLKNFNFNLESHKPIQSFYLDSEFSFYDYIFALEKSDFCLANYDISTDSIIYQISNYLNKPILTTDFKNSNINKLNVNFSDFVSGKSKMRDEHINRILNEDLVDRGLLQSSLIELLS